MKTQSGGFTVLAILGRSQSINSPSYRLLLVFFLLVSPCLLLFHYRVAVKMVSTEISTPSEPQVIPSNEKEVVVADEKINEATRTNTLDFEKKNIQISDEAGELAARALASGPAEAEVSRRVLRKIDLYILPILCVTYGQWTLYSPITDTILT